jgi:cell division septation protein DedD
VSRSYYVIELSARWLTALLAGLAAVMVIAFALGYGAAWSVLSSERAEREMVARQAAAVRTEIPEVVIPTPVPAAFTEPSPAPTATPFLEPEPEPEPTREPTPRPRPTTVAASGFFVQLLASSREAAIEEARGRLVGLGFPRDNQQVTSTSAPGVATLYKLRIGPFPDRPSADRVAQRMSAAGFPDAWVVAP